MNKRKKKYIDSLIGLSCTILFMIFLNNYYEEYVKRPTKSYSPRSSGMLFDLFVYLIDKKIGKIGVYIFFTLICLFFLYHFIVELKEEKNKKKNK